MAALWCQLSCLQCNTYLAPQNGVPRIPFEDDLFCSFAPPPLQPIPAWDITRSLEDPNITSSSANADTGATGAALLPAALQSAPFNDAGSATATAADGDASPFEAAARASEAGGFEAAASADHHDGSAHEPTTPPALAERLLSRLGSSGSIGRFRMSFDGGHRRAGSSSFADAHRSSLTRRHMQQQQPVKEGHREHQRRDSGLQRRQEEAKRRATAGGEAQGQGQGQQQEQGQLQQPLEAREQFEERLAQLHAELGEGEGVTALLRASRELEEATHGGNATSTCPGDTNGSGASSSSSTSRGACEAGGTAPVAAASQRQHRSSDGGTGVVPAAAAQRQRRCSDGGVGVVSAAAATWLMADEAEDTRLMSLSGLLAAQPTSPFGRLRRDLFGASMDFVAALCEASRCLARFPQSERMSVLRHCLRRISAEVEAAAAQQVPVLVPIGGGARERVLRLCAEESVIFNSAEKVRSMCMCMVGCGYACLSVVVCVWWHGRDGVWCRTCMHVVLHHCRGCVNSHAGSSGGKGHMVAMELVLQRGV